MELDFVSENLDPPQEAKQLKSCVRSLRLWGSVHCQRVMTVRGARKAQEKAGAAAIVVRWRRPRARSVSGDGRGLGEIAADAMRSNGMRSSTEASQWR